MRLGRKSFGSVSNVEIALRHFRKALRKNPNDPVTLQHIASVLHRKAQLLRRHGEDRREEIVNVEGISK